MSAGQITIHLLPNLKVQFESYAKRVGISASEFAKLLILRERHLRRMIALRDAGKLPPNTRQPRGSGLQREKVTAHVSSRSEVRNFDAYAKACGLNRNLAGSWLIETELKERWLQSALSKK
jgi:hypothetical protein